MEVLHIKGSPNVLITKRSLVDNGPARVHLVRPKERKHKELFLCKSKTRNILRIAQRAAFFDMTVVTAPTRLYYKRNLNKDPSWFDRLSQNYLTIELTGKEILEVWLDTNPLLPEGDTRMVVLCQRGGEYVLVFIEVSHGTEDLPSYVIKQELKFSMKKDENSSYAMHNVVWNSSASLLLMFGLLQVSETETRSVIVEYRSSIGSGKYDFQIQPTIHEHQINTRIGSSNPFRLLSWNSGLDTVVTVGLYQGTEAIRSLAWTVNKPGFYSIPFIEKGQVITSSGAPEPIIGIAIDKNYLIPQNTKPVLKLIRGKNHISNFILT